MRPQTLSGPVRSIQRCSRGLFLSLKDQKVPTAQFRQPNTFSPLLRGSTARHMGISTHIEPSRRPPRALHSAKEYIPQLQPSLST
jgi:hypothetical protein